MQRRPIKNQRGENGMKTLDLNDPKDARFFLETQINVAMKQNGMPNITEVILASGRKLQIKDMTDSECLQYAIELLPIYQTAFPDKVEIHHEQ